MTTKRLLVLVLAIGLAGCETLPSNTASDGATASTQASTSERSSRASPPAGPLDSSEVDPNAAFEQAFEAKKLRLPRALSVQETDGAETKRRSNLFRARAALPAEGLEAEDAAGGTEIHIFAIGQADSMLIIGPPPARKTLLVDAGELNWNSRANCNTVRKRVKELTGTYRVDYLLLTHFHLDHSGNPESENDRGRITPSGGIFCLLDGGPEFFKVGTLMDPGDTELPYAPKRPKIHEAIINQTPAWIAAGSLGRRIGPVFGSQAIRLGDGIKIDIVVGDGRVSDSDLGALAKAKQAEPDLYSESAASPNDFSIGFELTVGDFEFFSAGDLSGAPGEAPYPLSTRAGFGQIYTNVESHLAESWTASARESDVEVYRANHHGSANSSTTDLLSLLKPDLVIYSCGGRHRHPAQPIADRMHSLDADQVVSSSVDDEEWSDGIFPEKYGNGWTNPVGDISIHVPPGGKSFVVASDAQSFEYPSKSDAEEAR